jgi:SRSO17 transposase
MIQPKKKNMERMAEKVPDSNEQGLQHFLSNSPWDERPVLNQVAADADRHLGGNPDSAFYIDETCFKKKGTKSVGVHRQWIGQLGKVDNCQCGVFAAIGCWELVTPVDFRLYLPKVWVDDPERCRKAGVPEEHIVYKRKQDHALEMVIHARAQGMRFHWVGCDGLYGHDPEFLRSLDRMGEVFMADVHKNQRIYCEDPDPTIPDPRNSKGRRPSKGRAQTGSIRVDKWVAEQPEERWQRVCVRDTTKGKLFVDVLHERIWLWDGREEKAKHWHLVVRREVDSPVTVKYSLCNGAEDLATDRLAYMQAQRYWIERAFQDAKGDCGMSDYQARGWRSWHHHMTMVLLTMLFFLEERLLHEDTIPLLSCKDITRLLCHYLPRRDVTEEEIFRQLQARHFKRQASINSAYLRQSAGSSSGDG